MSSTLEPVPSGATPGGTSPDVAPSGAFGSRTSRPAWLILAVLVFVEIISALETSMVVFATPTFMRIFDADAAQVGWTFTAFLLVAAGSAAICGRLGDIYGRERVLVVLLLIATVGSIVSLVSTSLWGVVVGRAIQGVAGAILPLCIGIARKHLDSQRAAVAIALVSGTAIAAGAASSVVAGLFLDYTSWHWMFVFTAVYGAVAAALVWFLLPRDTVKKRTERLDWVGALGFAPAIAATLLGITFARTYGWTDPMIMALIVGGLAVLALWAMWELRQTSPIVNLRFFTNRKVALTMLATVVMGLGPMGVTTTMNTLVFQTPTDAPFGLGLKPTTAGLWTFAVAMVAFCFTPYAGRLAARMGARVSLMVGSVLFAISSAMMMFVHSSLVGVVIAVGLVSVATTFAYTSFPNLLVEAVPEENTSEVVGTNSVLRTASMAIGVAIGTVLLSSSIAPGTPYSTESALNLLCIYLVVLSLVTVGIAMAVSRKRA